jgi:hypothetical protein
MRVNWGQVLSGDAPMPKDLHVRIELAKAYAHQERHCSLCFGLWNKPETKKGKRKNNRDLIFYCGGLETKVGAFFARFSRCASACRV